MCISLSFATVVENTFCSGKQQSWCASCNWDTCKVHVRLHINCTLLLWDLKPNWNCPKILIFPKKKKKQISWPFNYHFSTVQFEVYTVVGKNYSLDAKVIGNLLLTFWRSLLPPLSGWSTNCVLFGRIVQGFVRLGDTYNKILQCLSLISWQNLTWNAC